MKVIQNNSGFVSGHALLVVCLFFALLLSGCSRLSTNIPSTNVNESTDAPSTNVNEVAAVTLPSADDVTSQETTDNTNKADNPDYNKSSQDSISENSSDITLTPLSAQVRNLKAGDCVDITDASPESIASCFYADEISDDIYSRILNFSYPEGCELALSELRYVRVLHYGFDGNTYIGELMVGTAVSDDIVNIFKELYAASYPIERMLLVDDYEANDDKSMDDNNTSAFNYRFVAGTTVLSKHSQGYAIDINPFYNPYVSGEDDDPYISPADAAEYADRDNDCPYFIRKNDICYNAFISRGFIWGGEWITKKDYQHFEKTFD